MQSRHSRATSRNFKNSAINSSFDDANFARARRQTRKLSSQDAPPTQPRAVPTFQCFATTPAGFVVCCASQTQKICNEIANFCAENLHDLGGVGVARDFFCVAKRCADSSENAAPPPAMSWQTSGVLCSARSRTSRKFKILHQFREFLAFLARKNLRDLGAEREFLCRQMLHRLK